jgi:hypothetical protein
MTAKKINTEHQQVDKRTLARGALNQARLQEVAYADARKMLEAYGPKLTIRALRLALLSGHIPDKRLEQAAHAMRVCELCVDGALAEGEQVGELEPEYDPSQCPVCNDRPVTSASMHNICVHHALESF